MTGQVSADNAVPFCNTIRQQIPEELGISTRQFLRWRDELRLLGEEAFPGQGRTRDEELESLKRELAQVQKERDSLKEAAAYFAKESK